MPAVGKFVQGWPQEGRDAFLLLGNLPRDQFSAPLSRSFICLRDNVAKMADWRPPESSTVV
jgi:hypothetical protein